jgi:hypothetical protein
MAVGCILSLADMLIFKFLGLAKLVVGEGTTAIRLLSEIRSVKQMGLHIVLKLQVQKCCYLCISYVPEGMVQVRSCARWN